MVNFPPRQIGKFMSEVLTLGFPDEEGEVVLGAIERKVPDGGRLFLGHRLSSDAWRCLRFRRSAVERRRARCPSVTIFTARRHRPSV